LLIRDKSKEKLRLKNIAEGNLKKKNSKFIAKKMAATTSWSNKKEKQLKRKIRHEKSSIANKKRKNDDIDQNEIDELQSDFNLLKKLKKKKISQSEFDQKFMSMNDDEN
jgi:ATP-dependent RNA helicase DDX55/SPB4